MSATRNREMCFLYIWNAILEGITEHKNIKFYIVHCTTRDRTIPQYVFPLWCINSIFSLCNWFIRASKVPLLPRNQHKQSHPHSLYHVLSQNHFSSLISFSHSIKDINFYSSQGCGGHSPNSIPCILPPPASAFMSYPPPIQYNWFTWMTMKTPVSSPLIYAFPPQPY